MSGSGDTSAKKNYQKALNRFIDDQRDEKVKDYHSFLKKKKIIPDADLDNLIDEFANTYVNKEVSLNSGKRASKDAKKKKRAPSAYNIFVGEKIKQYTTGTPKENMQKAINEWNSMTLEEKKAYKDAYKAKEVEPEEILPEKVDDNVSSSETE